MRNYYLFALVSFLAACGNSSKQLDFVSDSAYAESDRESREEGVKYERRHRQERITEASLRSHFMLDSISMWLSGKLPGKNGWSAMKLACWNLHDVLDETRNAFAPHSFSLFRQMPEDSGVIAGVIEKYKQAARMNGVLLKRGKCPEHRGLHELDRFLADLDSAHFTSDSVGMTSAEMSALVLKAAREEVRLSKLNNKMLRACISPEREHGEGDEIYGPCRVAEIALINRGLRPSQLGLSEKDAELFRKHYLAVP